MKVAITADVHLTQKSEHPERYQALDEIVRIALCEGVQDLIIAGDLFDATIKNHAEFDQFCQQDGNKDVQFWIIPGNHDPNLSPANLTADNIHVIYQACVKELGPERYPFVFLPYRYDKGASQQLFDLRAILPVRWTLISHGDWLDGRQLPNVYESGYYMPLTRADLIEFKPEKVFLGHIHAPMDREPVYYTGSPCGLDISETGRRRFLLFDPKTGQVQSQILPAPVLYFNFRLLAIPLENEEEYARGEIEKAIRSWDLSEEERRRAVVRVRAYGYSANKRELKAVLEDAFAGFSRYKNEGVDVDDVSEDTDYDKSRIAEEVRKHIESRIFLSGPDDPSRDEIMLQAMKAIYGE